MPGARKGLKRRARQDRHLFFRVRDVHGHGRRPPLRHVKGGGPGGSWGFGLGGERRAPRWPARWCGPRHGLGGPPRALRSPVSPASQGPPGAVPALRSARRAPSGVPQPRDATGVSKQKLRRRGGRAVCCGVVITVLRLVALDVSSLSPVVTTESASRHGQCPLGSQVPRLPPAENPRSEEIVGTGPLQEPSTQVVCGRVPSRATVWQL